MNNCFKINFFGGMSVEADNRLLLNSMSKLHQHWKLLAYLVINKNSFIPASDLIGALNGDAEINMHSQNALKNTIYCLRQELGDNSYILYNEGCYKFNDKNTLITDIEIFDKLADSLNTISDTDIKLSVYKNIIKLYKGNFLPQLYKEQWAAEKNLYYKKKYIKAVSEYLKILYDNHMYSEILQVTAKASAIDTCNEKFYLYMFKALYALNMNTVIVSTYMKLNKIFKNALKLKLCDDIKAIYEKADKKLNKIETELSVIKENLKEAPGDTAGCGPFFCGFDVFKQIYQLNVRAAAREERRVILVLLTILGANGEIPQNNILLDAMLELKEVLATTIRKNDVYTQYSRAQYLLMLSCDCTEKAEIAVKRIEANYKNYLNQQMLKMLYKVSLQDFV